MKGKIILCLTAAAVALGSVSVFADEPITSEVTKGIFSVFAQKTEGGDILKVRRGGIMDFSKAVEDGVISQQTADSITAFLEAQAKEMKEKLTVLKEGEKNEEPVLKTERFDMFEQLVNEGIVTTEEAEALKQYTPKLKDISISFIGIDTKDLVEKGVISQQTADNIEAFMKEKSEKMKAEMEAFRENNDKEGIVRREFKSGEFKSGELKGELKEEFKANLDEGIESAGLIFEHKRVDLFEELVENGIITQSEADAIKAAMPERPELPEGAEQFAKPARTFRFTEAGPQKEPAANSN